MRATRLRFAAVSLALGALALPPQTAFASSELKMPEQVTAGVVATATLNVPASVAAIEGRVLVSGGNADLVGVAPARGGIALTPVATTNGFAFGAYDLKSKNGMVTLRLVLLPNVSGSIDVRVLIDAAADKSGTPLTLAAKELLATLRVAGRPGHFPAPGGAARGAPPHASSAVKPGFGKTQIGTDDLDVARAGWYATHGDSKICDAQASAGADANGDGCVDIVDLQAITAAQASSSHAPATAAAATITAPNPARTFTVTSAADTVDARQGNGVCADASGQCTLRAAIMESNWLAGLTRINFNLAGTAPVTIQLASSTLPNVGTSTSSVYIDGYSQPGSRPNDIAHGTDAIPGVEIRGASASSDWIFYVPQKGNTFRGLLLDNALRGVFLDSVNATGNVIVGNFMGFNRDGSLPGRGADGVYFNNGAHDNVLGTTDVADRNVIGNYDKAVYSYGPGTDANVVQNNALCVRPDGGTAICQTAVDFDFGPKNALVGGSNPNEGNVVGPTCCNSVELSHGWDPSGVDTSAKWHISGNRIIGNWLGFKVDGSYDPSYRSAQSVPTFDNGQAVNVYDGSYNNVIQGNYIASVYDGITVASLNTTGNIVQGNIIGTSPLGQPAPLAGWGAYLRWDTDIHSFIGNHISNAATGGIGLIESNVTRITLSQNIVDSTSGPAIYFAPDPNDPTTGANGLFAAPSFSATPLLVSGSAVPNATVEVYRSQGTAGQAAMPIAYLGSTVASGAGAWSVIGLSLNNGDVLTALQTRADGTSSLLARNVIVSDAQSAPTASFTWLQSNQAQDVSFTDTSTGQPTSWSWDFGDGVHASTQNPVHSYAAAGDYTVVLNASNSFGSTSATQTVHVIAVATVFAADSFGRQLASGWGSADVGGSYTLLADSGSYTVGGGTGQMTLAKANYTRSALLNSVNARDVDLKVRFAVSKAPAGGSEYVYLVARSVGAGASSYRPKVILSSNGAVSVHAGVVNNGNESSLGNAVTVPGLTVTAGSYMWLRAQITGTNPTSIKVRAWRDGDPEPSTWQFTASNSLAALQSAGGVGMVSYLGTGSTNAPVTVTFDDFVAVDPNGGTVVAPTASYTYAQETNSLVVDFTDQSTGSPTSWLWDFGDGTTSTQRNPSKTYATAGAYLVTLTASNSTGSNSATQTVSVTAPVAVTYARDSFSRTLVGGWGSADTGGPYSGTSGSAFNVANGAGSMAPPRAGASRGATLDNVSARDVDIAVRVTVDKRPVGGIIWAYDVVRHNGNNEYVPKILFMPDGTVAVHAGLVISDSESPIGNAVTVPGLTYTPGSFIWLRAQVTGVNPTTIKVRAWADGQPEPTVWQYTGTDSSASVQTAGSVGLQAYTDTRITNAPIAVLFDDYLVRDPNGGSGVTSTATLVGAGDIAGCGWTADSDTAAVIQGVSGTVFTAGDNVYPDGSAAAFSSCYDPSWGVFKSRTRPVPGNHDVQADASATAYFDYFGANAGAGRRGFYAYEAGAWRVYGLNSECSETSSCQAQYNWLAADLAAAPHTCSMVIWHRPRFSEGPHGNANDLDALFKLLYANGVEMLVSGHDHMYERLTPADGNGNADPTRGVREFVVGTGGTDLYTPATTLALVEAENHVTHGVLRLDLAPGSFQWHFLPAGSGTFVDSGTGNCH